MFLHRPRFWFWSTGLLLVAGVALWATWRNRPLAKLELPDGTSVLLRSVTSEPLLRYKMPPPPGTKGWRWLQYWFAGPAATVHLPGPGPTFLFSQIQHGRPEGPRSIQMIRTFFDANRPFEARLSGAGDLVYWANPVFPRRDKTFHAQVQVGSGWHDWELPNPVYGQAFPEWNAEEFPIKRVIGDIEYTAQGWRKGSSGPYLNFELRYQGKKVGWPVVSATTTIYSDPTGNESSYMLSTAEPVWKVRQQIITGRQAPLGPTHKVTLAKMQAPDGKEKGLRKVEGLPFPGTTTYFGYAGPGNFCFVDGKPRELDAKGLEALAIAQGVSLNALRVGDSPDGKGVCVFGSASVPVFLLIRQSPAGEQQRILERGYRKGEEWKEFRLINQTGRDNVDAVTLQLLEPAGTEIDVDLFWHEEFEVEMFVKPPPPELGPPKSANPTP